jgi:hypothetical protein
MLTIPRRQTFMNAISVLNDNRNMPWKVDKLNNTLYKPNYEFKRMMDSA